MNSALQQLKAFCDAEWDKAQAEIETEGFSVELSLRTDVFEEVLQKINEIQAIEDSSIGFTDE